MMFVVLNDLNLTIALPQAVTNEQYQCHLTQLVKRSHSTKLKAGAMMVSALLCPSLQ